MKHFKTINHKATQAGRHPKVDMSNARPKVKFNCFVCWMAFNRPRELASHYQKPKHKSRLKEIGVTEFIEDLTLDLSSKVIEDFLVLDEVGEEDSEDEKEADVELDNVSSEEEGEICPSEDVKCPEIPLEDVNSPEAEMTSDQGHQEQGHLEPLSDDELVCDEDEVQDTELRRPPEEADQTFEDIGDSFEDFGNAFEDYYDINEQEDVDEKRSDENRVDNTTSELDTSNSEKSFEEDSGEEFAEKQPLINSLESVAESISSSEDEDL